MRLSTAVVVSAVLLSAVRAADPPPPLSESVRKAVKDHQVVDTDNLGKAAARASYREVMAEGGVLAGFEVGLAKWGGNEVPFALRPIYRTEETDWLGQTAGSLSSRQVKRTVKVLAKPGYAVGGMWVRSGSSLDRLCLHYYRIRDGGLDPADNYASEWVGTSDGGSERYFGGSGRPIVGLFADAPEEQVRAFGLTFARVAPAPPPKPPDVGEVPAPGAETPPGGKSKLELEAEARQAQPEPAGDDGTSLMLVVVPVGLLAVPTAVVGVFFLGRPGKARRGRYADRPNGPSPRIETQPLDERPELARRLEPYLPASRGQRRRPVSPAGATQRPEAEVPKPVVVGSQPVTALPTPPPDDVPPFFMCRAVYKARHMRMTRVYVLENEMLIIDAGAGADVNQVAGVTAAVLSGGGVIGSMIGGAVGSMVADGQKAKGEAFQKKLDQLDLPALLAWADQAGNFRAKFTDVVGLSIDPPAARSMWRGNQTRAVGTFRFRHLQRGEFAFEFLIGAEIRGAIEVIRRSAGGPNLHLGNGWDEATAAYLVGL